jgi:hypothetical protein
MPSVRRQAKQRSVSMCASSARPEPDPELLHMIRRLLAKPMEQRMHFLRVRLPNGGSCL